MTRESPTSDTRVPHIRRASRTVATVVLTGLALAGCQAGASSSDATAGGAAQVSRIESQLDSIQRDLDVEPG